MSQPQTTKKGQNRTPVADGRVQSDTSAANPKKAQSQIKGSAQTRTASKWREQVPAKRGMSTPVLMGVIIGGIVIVGLVIVGIVAPLLSGSGGGGGSSDNTLGVERTYSVAGAGDHRTGTINYASIPPYVIPPVGGPHNQWWLTCGIYDQPVPNENAVHDLEHGAVWVTYQPNLDQNAVDTLRGIARQYQKIVLSPYPSLSAPIVASAWGGGGHTGFQIKVQPGQWTQLQSFITKHSGASDAPEPTAACTNGQGATPMP